MFDYLESFLGKEQAHRVRNEYSLFRKTHPEADTPLLFLKQAAEEGLIPRDVMHDLCRSLGLTNSPGLDQGHPSSPNTDQDPLTILELIGHGGMGDVHRAKDCRLNREVALKRINNEHSSPEAMLAFLTEAQITAQLDHPNVVPVYGLEASPGKPIAYTMKIIRGKELRSYINEIRESYTRRQPLADEQELNSRLELFLHICDAIEFAHSRGIIHRDLKPENIMLGSFHEVYVMDWGLAKLIGLPNRNDPVAESDILTVATASGHVKGTPQYLSPEQALSKQLDARSDQYSLGLILYELLSLNRARQGSDVLSLLAAAIHGENAPFKHAFGEQIPRELQAITEKALNFDRSNRYLTVKDLSDDVRRYLRSEAVLAQPDTLWQKTVRLAGRYKQETLFALLFALLISASSLAWTFFSKEAHLQELQQRVKTIGLLLSRVDAQGDQLINDLTRHEERLERLSGVVSALLDHGLESSEPFFNQTQFSSDQPALRLSFSPTYQTAISPTFPSTVIFDSIGNPETLRISKLLSPVRTHLIQLYLSGSDALEHLGNADYLQRVVTEQDSPLAWSYIALDEGLLLLYPGRGSIPPSYDHRNRPWYQEAKAHKNLFWADPHLDTLGQGLLYPCIKPLYDDQNRFRGAVGIDLRFSYLVPKLLTLKGLPGFVESFLVDNEGAILVRSSHAKLQQGLEGIHQPLQHPPFPYVNEWQPIKNQRLSFTQIQTEDRTLWLASYHLKPLNLFYLVLIDPELLQELIVPQTLKAVS